MNCAVAENDIVIDIKRILMRGIDKHIRATYASQYDAESDLDIPQEMISRLRNDKYDKFSIVWLLITAERVGAKVSINVE